MQWVDIRITRTIDDFQTLTADPAIAQTIENAIKEVKKLARQLNGFRVLHVNTLKSGGIANMFDTLISLMRDVGLRAERGVLEAEPEFFESVIPLHHALLGMNIHISERVWHLHRYYNCLNAKDIPDRYDFIVVHDPAPIALRHFWKPPLRAQMFKSRSSTCWIWRCHSNASAANKDVWTVIQTYLKDYDAVVFTMAGHEPPSLKANRIYYIPPSIDPFDDKNKSLPTKTCREIVMRFSVDVQRPILLQVARFDPAKDPIGVIDAYRIVKIAKPEVQLVLIGYLASDDPNAWTYYKRIIQYAQEDPDIHIFSQLNGVRDLEVNAFQRMAAVNILKSIEEGFGLVVTEALWKGKPVIGGNVGGLRLQIKDIRENDDGSGYLVSSVEECAECCLRLLDNPALAAKLGQNGKRHVAQNFLSIHHLRNYLKMFHELLAM